MVDFSSFNFYILQYVTKVQFDWLAATTPMKEL